VAAAHVPMTDGARDLQLHTMKQALKNLLHFRSSDLLG
jgi:hypothetical protein